MKIHSLTLSADGTSELAIINTVYNYMRANSLLSYIGDVGGYLTIAVLFGSSQNSCCIIRLAYANNWMYKYRTTDGGATWNRDGFASTDTYVVT